MRKFPDVIVLYESISTRDVRLESWGSLQKKRSGKTTFSHPKSWFGTTSASEACTTLRPGRPRLNFNCCHKRASKFRRRKKKKFCFLRKVALSIHKKRRMHNSPWEKHFLCVKKSPAGLIVLAFVVCCPAMLAGVGCPKIPSRLRPCNPYPAKRLHPFAYKVGRRCSKHFCLKKCSYLLQVQWVSML